MAHRREFLVGKVSRRSASITGPTSVCVCITRWTGSVMITGPPASARSTMRTRNRHRHVPTADAVAVLAELLACLAPMITRDPVSAKSRARHIVASPTPARASKSAAL